MENQIFIAAYGATLLLCASLTVGLVLVLSPGLKVFFQSFTKDPETASFFSKLVKVMLISCGLAGALDNGYTTTEKANWLTLGFDMTDQVEATIENLWAALMTLAIFLILTHLIDKHWNK